MAENETYNFPWEIGVITSCAAERLDDRGAKSTLPGTLVEFLRVDGPNGDHASNVYSLENNDPRYIASNVELGENGILPIKE